MVVTFEVTDKRNGVFKVKCTFTGGAVLTMSISGPLGRQEDLDTSAVGTPQRTGNDSYSAEILLQGGNNSDTYICFSSNIVSNSSSSSYLKGIGLFFLLLMV